MSRSEMLKSELRRFVALLADDPQCRRAILFGSLAADDIHEGSDIDLVVIQESSLPFWQRMREMRRATVAPHQRRSARLHAGRVRKPVPRTPLLPRRGAGKRPGHL